MKRLLRFVVLEELCSSVSMCDTNNDPGEEKYELEYIHESVFLL